MSYDGVTMCRFSLLGAKNIADAYKAKLDIGESNVIDYNKSQLNLLEMEKDLEVLSSERSAKLIELQTLNGGKVIVFSESSYTEIQLPKSFDSWYNTTKDSIPELAWINKELEQSKSQVKLERANSLPKITGGYMSEYLASEQFRGVTVGLSIPLWENKNKVNYAKLNTMAVEQSEMDYNVKVYNNLLMRFNKTSALQKSLVDYKKRLLVMNNTQLLDKALENGQLSLIEYLLEMQYYYRTNRNLLELEKQVHIEFAELNKNII